MIYEMESGIAVTGDTNGLWLIQRLKMLPRYLEQKYPKQKGKGAKGKGKGGKKLMR